MVLRCSLAVLTLIVVVTSAIKLGDMPTIEEMRSFPKLDGKKVDMVTEMSSEFSHVGQCLLLEDRSKVANMIDKHHGNAVDISQGIVKEWVAGKGRHPVDWRTLLECLREVSLYHLEVEILEEMEDRPSEGDHVLTPPRRKTHISVHDDSHPVEREQHLLSALGEVKNWEFLCSSFGISESEINTISLSDNDEKAKQEDCLRRYFRSGHADWSHIVVVVAEPPSNNKRLACKIALDHMGMDKKECHTYLGMNHDEL